VGLLIVVGIAQEKGIGIRKHLETRHGFIQWAVTAAGLAALLFLGIYREGYIAQQFIYARL